MTTNNPDTLVRRFIDGDLPDAEVRDALHRIADDPEARAQLRFELDMTRDLAASRSSSAPADFADRTMEALAEREESEAPADAPSLADRLRDWWAAWTDPQPVQLRPVYAPVAILLLAAAVLWPVLSTTAPGPASNGGTSVARAPATQQNAGRRTAGQQTSTQQPASGTADRQIRASTAEASGARPVRSTDDGTVWTRFVFTSSRAESVAVAGDFSQWEPIPLSSRTVNGQTVWTGLVPVGRGEHEYQFVINGDKWVTDPLAPVKRSDGFGAKNAVLKL